MSRRISTVREAEDKAEEIAKQLGYELGYWHKRWHWRKVGWRAGVWYAGHYRTKLETLDAIVSRFGK